MTGSANAAGAPTATSDAPIVTALFAPQAFPRAAAALTPERTRFATGARNSAVPRPDSMDGPTSSTYAVVVLAAPTIREGVAAAASRPCVKLCLDEHYSPQIADQLRRAGHDVTSVEERPELVGLPDSELLAAVEAEQRALLTENVRDVAPLIALPAANGESHHGVIYTSPESMPRAKSTAGA